VTGTYATVITVVALLLAAWALISAALNRPRGLALLAGGLALEVLLLVFAIGGVVQMARSDRTFARAEFVGYLLGLLAIPPFAFYWSWGEKSRSGTMVIALAFLITPVMVLRVQQVWAGSVG
jgi:RsiW-degrading membrane proteinase PrsW (M82 family)